jgi:hypothetical protein
MANQSTPQLTPLGTDKYSCDDIKMLHSWLEMHSYTFYGEHEPGEYGRFSRQEHHQHDGGPVHIHSFIQVFTNGEVFAPDPNARELLADLIAG